MPEDEETPSTPGRLGEGVLQDGLDPGAGRRAVIREANAARQAQEVAREARKGQKRAQRPPRVPIPARPAPPFRGRRTPTPAVPLAERAPSGLHPTGLARLLEALI